jgi:hypothetical protein
MIDCPIVPAVVWLVEGSPGAAEPGAGPRSYRDSQLYDGVVF